jgi:myo-inositol-1(or 4)-monophosphatase
MTPDLQIAQDTAAQIAHRAGEVLVDMFERPISHTTKSSPRDIVTEADRQAEAVIVDALIGAFPAHHIVGEEGGGTGAAVEQADYRWYVDPLDGTTNYANGIPLFSVSLALTDRHMRPLVGVVYNPISGELYGAQRGAGVTRNGQPVSVSAKTALGDCVLATGFPYQQEARERVLREWERLLNHARSLRRIGSAALELAWVASGRLDGFWEPNLHPWDCLAGILCVQEAGGAVTDYQGEDSDALYSGAQVISSNGHIHRDLLDVLAE